MGHGAGKNDRSEPYEHVALKVPEVEVHRVDQAHFLDVLAGMSSNLSWHLADQDIAPRLNELCAGVWKPLKFALPPVRAVQSVAIGDCTRFGTQMAAVRQSAAPHGLTAAIAVAAPSRT